MDPFKAIESKNPPVSSPLAEAVRSYLAYFAAGTSHTARAKRLDIQHLLDFLCQHRSVGSPRELELSTLDYSAVAAFVEDRLKRGEKPATVARRLATIKHMGRTFAEQFHGFINPARAVRPPKVAAAKPKALTRTEIEQIHTKALNRLQEKATFIRHRNHVIFSFLIDTGLRADEVRLLKRSQLDERLEWIYDVRTKGKRYRNVYITSVMRPILALYLEKRSQELKHFFANISRKVDRKLPLFISTFNAELEIPESFLMGTKTLWRAVRELSVEQKVHPHLLRHSFAIDLLESSNDIRLVSQALGHSDIKVTMRYTERRDEEVAVALERSRKKRS
jgi:integrase/recombinase XerC